MTNLDELTSWHSDWRGLRVAVLGLGVTGFAAADTLAELGAEVLVLADRAEPELEDILDVLGVAHFTGASVAEQVGRLAEFAPELIVTSPGVRPESLLLTWAAERGVAVWVDVDLAWRLRDKTKRVAEWILITGTNGKTTTTQLTTAMLAEHGLRVASCGNIGVSILDAVRDPEGFDVLVVELSSFQLHYLGDEIRPHSAAVLNIADDHLDWHGGLSAYTAAKGKVFNNTRVACVYNVADPVTMKLVEDADVQEGARAIGFGLAAPRLSELGFVEGILCDRAFIAERAESALPLASLDEVQRIGVVTPHLLANIAAAAALARSIGASADAVREAIAGFKLAKHRIELVAEQAGVTWIDDSKATNPHAAAASLAGFESVVWLVGGLLKGVDLRPLLADFGSRLLAAVVIGVDQEPVLAAFAEALPDLPVLQAPAVTDGDAAMVAAVRLAAGVAVPGATVLLAPAAASMDQFSDYAARGAAFAAAVRSELGGDLE